MGGRGSKDGNRKEVVIIGLDNAGKTTLFKQLESQFKLDDVVDTAPTIGCNHESMQYKGVKLNVFDMGGRESIRNLWSHNLVSADAIIIVIDSNDESRFEEITKEIENIFKEDIKPDCLFLIYANKQDAEGSIGPEELSKELNLSKFCKNYTWKIQACSTKNSDGLAEGMDWLSKALKKQHSKKKSKTK